MFDDSNPSTVMLFSHPNHELAVFGLLQRLKPNIIFLTDGGSVQRLTESRNGLTGINLLNRAVFLDFPESSFYQSLLERDSYFFDRLVEKVAAHLAQWRPSQILCDAVEFYNPVHDMALPITKSAVPQTAAVEIFEVPLMYQRPASTETYEVQRFPPSRHAQQIEVRLTEVELAQKLAARKSVYPTLIKALGTPVAKLPDAHIATEVIGPAARSLPRPGADQTLRYNWRGQLRLQHGEVDQAITYEEHYLPVVAGLMRDRS